MKDRGYRNGVTFPPLQGGGNVTLRCFGMLCQMLRSSELPIAFLGSVTKRNKKRNNLVTEPCYAMN